MPDRIKLLPEVVANQIAAGEVVNRPASVVKEMMENAMDAGASCVTVNFRDGGRELIQIVDDGCGMSPIDARMAFDRHATSKISSVDDIYALRTFGFRGEALASIAAVSQVELRTRREDDDTGTVTTLHGGRFVSQEPAACPAGSQFMVRNLFYNVPARRKFMDEVKESRRQIRAEFNRAALCNPGIRFELYENDQPVSLLEPSTLAGRIVDVVGKNIRNNLLEVSVDTSIVSVRGFVGRPEAAMNAAYTRKDSMRYLFVNGRYFKSKYLYGAIINAYEHLIPEGSVPAYFLYLTVDPERVDVNVHPQKIEVRFADESAVRTILNAAVRETLAKTGAVPMMSFSEEDAAVEIPPANRGGFYDEPKSSSGNDYNPFREGYADDSADASAGMRNTVSDFSIAAPHTQRRDPFAGLDVFSSTEFETMPSGHFGDEGSRLEYIPSVTAEQGTLIDDEPAAFENVTSIGNRMALALYGGRPVVVDLRRARERMLYDSCLEQLRSGSVASRRLLFPERLTLSAEEYAAVEEHAVDFAAAGFDFDYTGNGSIDVLGVPDDLGSERIDEVIYGLLHMFDSPQGAADARNERTAAVMALNGSRSLPKRMSHDEAAALLASLAESGNTGYTPSGKPIMAELPAEFLRTKLDL